MEQAPLRRIKLATELRAEIARAGKTKASVAAAAGISSDVLRRRLNGHYAFPVEDVVAICAYLGVPYADLIERAREVDQVA